MNILLMHGPNLNLLGQRDSAHYGNVTLAEIEAMTAATASQHDLNVIPFQSNHEGNLIHALQKHGPDCSGIIVNPGALTHYSYALYDALIDTRLPAIEVHLSAISGREVWRRHSVITPACIHSIQGKKLQGYQEAVRLLVEHLKK